MRRPPALALLAAAVLLAGCGPSPPPASRISGHILTIYFSGPMTGASSLGATAALQGARIALDRIHARIGAYRIRLRELDDSTAQSGAWDPNQTTLAARQAAQDPTTIAYLGDYNSGASAISIPLLNRLRIPQISPGSSAVGLTGSGPGAAPGEPQKYYPTGIRTFARVVPTDADQAIALLDAERSVGCHSTFVLDDGEVDSEDAAVSFLLTAQSAGLRVVAVQAFQRRADYTPLARSVEGSGADCVLVSAIDAETAASLSERIAHTLPTATIFATGALVDDGYARELPPALDSRLIVVSPGAPPRAYPATGRQFVAEYARQYGPAPPSAIFGFQAMSLVLSAINRATDHGRRAADRGQVRDQLFSGRTIHGVLGTFRITRTGDSSLRRFAIYRVAAARLVFSRFAVH